MVFSKERWLRVSSRDSLSEFADTFKSFFELSNEFSNVAKLAIFLISGENASQYLEKSSKKVNKPKCSVNLSLTISLKAGGLSGRMTLLNVLKLFST